MVAFHPGELGAPLSEGDLPRQVAQRLSAAGKQLAVVRHHQSPLGGSPNANLATKAGTSTARKARGKLSDPSTSLHDVPPPPRFDGTPSQHQQQQSAAAAGAAEVRGAAQKPGSGTSGPVPNGMQAEVQSSSRKRITPMHSRGELQHVGHVKRKHWLHCRGTGIPLSWLPA